jgi:hypothetical protein
MDTVAVADRVEAPWTPALFPPRLGKNGRLGNAKKKM